MGETFNNFKAQIQQFWQTFDKGQKIRIVIAGILTFVLIIGLVVYTNTPRYSVLYSDLDIKDAGEIRDKIKELKVPIKVEGTTIMVPKDKIDELRITLAMEGLPRNDLTYPQILESKFNETSSEKDQKKLLYLQSVITNGIKSLSGVEWAQVNLYIPNESTFVLDSDKTESSAGIIIKMKHGAQSLDNNQVNGIVQFVCKSVKGLKKENVSIIDDMARPLLEESDDFDTQVNTQMDMQENVKRNIQKSIVKFLEAVFGPGNVSVEVATKLNFNNEVQNSVEYLPIDKERNEGIIRNMEQINKDWTDSGAAGVPGTDSNTDITQYAEVDSSKAKYSEASSVVNYDINEMKKQIIKEQGNIESLSISVIVNKSNLKQEALANIEGLKTDVKELVRCATQGLQTSPVEFEKSFYVQIMDFDDSLEQKIKEAQANEQEQKDKEFYIMIGTAAAAVLVFAAALFLFIRRRKNVNEFIHGDEEYATAQVQNSTPIADIELDEKNEIKKKLDKFITQKPDQVAQLLKSWLNEE